MVYTNQTEQYTLGAHNGGIARSTSEFPPLFFLMTALHHAR